MTAGATAWFERWPELLEWERQRFAERGLPCEINEAERARGRLLVRSLVPFGSEQIEIVIAYPSEYPELPPVVYGEPGLLQRHQHASGGNFCLLERPLDDWRARDWGAADLVAEQLEALLDDTIAGPEIVTRAEAPVPEPATAFYGFARDMAVLMPGNISYPEAQGGVLRVRQSTPNIIVVEDIDGQPGDGQVLGTFPDGAKLKVPWHRVESAPLGGNGDGQSVARWIRQHFTGLLMPTVPPKLRNNNRLKQPVREMVALVFAEEGPRQGEYRDAWLFVLVDRSDGTERAFLIHAQTVSANERRVRTPELAGLEDMRVVVVGAGSLGGDVAVELAKAGIGQIDIVDYDRFEAGNTVRHRLDLQYVGQPKAQAVAIACQRANPFTVATATDLRLGADGWEEQSPLATIAALVDEADLVVDATASHQISQLLGRVCSDPDTPLVAGWLTEGSVGAEVVRIIPGRTCCWTCFASQHRAGELLQAEAGAAEAVVPQGCGFPTTTGSGFDAVEGAMSMTRLAVQTLQPDGGYPDAGHDHLILNFRHSSSDEIPRAAAELLPPTSECPQCHVSAGVIAEH